MQAGGETFVTGLEVLTASVLFQVTYAVAVTLW